MAGTPTCRTGEPGSRPTGHRAASREVPRRSGPKPPELGRLADLAGNNTTIKGANLKVGPPVDLDRGLERHLWYGRTPHPGIREHAMGSILSGIVLHGRPSPTAGTFPQFPPTTCARLCDWPR